MTYQAPLHKLDPYGHEVLFAPFHDPDLCKSFPFQVIDFEKTITKTEYLWCWTNINWLASDDSVHFAIECEVNRKLDSYSHVILCLTAPEEVKFRLLADFGSGFTKQDTAFYGEGGSQEVYVKLDRQGENQVLHKISLEVTTANNNLGGINLFWFGLCHKKARDIMQQSSLARTATDWQSLTIPVDQWGEVRFGKQLLFDEKTLDEIRAKIALPGWKEHFAIMKTHAAECLKRSPETDIMHVLPYNDPRYIRYEEKNRPPFYWDALTLAFVGLVSKEQQYIEHALRYLFATLDTSGWIESSVCNVPTSTWDTRSFVAEMTVTSVTILADWLDYTLTGYSRELIRQAVWDRGLSLVTRDLMQHEYMQYMNQGAVFSRAAVLGGLLLEDSWSIHDYTDRWFQNMTGVLKRYIPKDGFCFEGPIYLCQSLQGVLFPIIAYSRKRGIPWQETVEKLFVPCENYLQAISPAPGRAIPLGDSRTSSYGGDAVAILAGITPTSPMNQVLDHCLRSGNIFKSSGTLTNSGGILALAYGPEKVGPSADIRPKYSKLRQGGIASICRPLGADTVGLTITAGSSQTGHAHPDKGQFILDLNGKSLFQDPGVANYDNLSTLQMRQSAFHNVLTPVLKDGTFPDQIQSALQSPMKSRQFLNYFFSSIDLGNAYKDYFSSYQRKITSPKASSYTIVDKGQNNTSRALAFHLQIPHEIEINNNSIVFTVDGLEILLFAEWAESITRADKYLDCDGNRSHHVVIKSQPKVDFDLKTTISLGSSL